MQIQTINNRLITDYLGLLWIITDYCLKIKNEILSIQTLLIN